MAIGLRVPNSPCTDGRLRQVSQISLTDRARARMSLDRVQLDAADTVQRPQAPQQRVDIRVVRHKCRHKQRRTGLCYPDRLRADLLERALHKQPSLVRSLPEKLENYADHYTLTLSRWRSTNQPNEKSSSERGALRLAGNPSKHGRGHGAKRGVPRRSPGHGPAGRRRARCRRRHGDSQPALRTGRCGARLRGRAILGGTSCCGPRGAQQDGSAHHCVPR